MLQPAIAAHSTHKVSKMLQPATAAHNTHKVSTMLQPAIAAHNLTRSSKCKPAVPTHLTRSSRRYSLQLLHSTHKVIKMLQPTIAAHSTHKVRWVLQLPISSQQHTKTHNRPPLWVNICHKKTLTRSARGCHFSVTQSQKLTEKRPSVNICH